MEYDLFLAVLAMHKRQTSHDVYIQDSYVTIHCDVCLHLDRCKKHYEKAEEDYYKEQQQIADDFMNSREETE